MRNNIQKNPDRETAGKPVDFVPCIRPMIRADASGAAAIAKQSFSRPWSEQGFVDAIENPNTICIAAELRTVGGNTAVDARKNDGAVENMDCGTAGRIAGCCILYRAADEAEIATIAVSPEFRRYHIADAMLSAIKENMPDLKLIVIHLDVRPSNGPARALYEKHGFTEDGIRKHFYRDPEEDAILMSLWNPPEAGFREA